MSQSGVTIEVEDIDFDMDSLTKELNILSTSVIEVGILDTETGKIQMIATVNEFGIKIKITDKMRAFLASQGFTLSRETKVITIPERSYIRRTVAEKEKKITNFIRKQFDLVFDGSMTADAALNSIGEFCVEETRKTMVEVDRPDNHWFTLSRKKGDNPLIDKGTLKSRISYRIVKG